MLEQLFLFIRIEGEKGERETKCVGCCLTEMYKHKIQ